MSVAVTILYKLCIVYLIRYTSDMFEVQLASLNPAAEIIHRARASARLTQHQLAEKINTSQSAVSRWEHGHDEPRISTLSAILRACGLRLVFKIEDDVDRAQIRQQLAMTPEQRLASVVNLSRTLDSAKKVV